MKKILILSSAFYPQQSARSFRATELARELAKQGHYVKVITVKGINQEQYCLQNNIQLGTMADGPIQDIEVKKGFISGMITRFLRRMLDLLFHYPSIKLAFYGRKALLNEREHFDALISVAVPYPNHWGVASIWSKIKAKVANVWIADCGDPFMYSHHDTFKKMPYFHILENNFLKKADFVTVPFKEMVLLFNQSFRVKFRVIPQGFRMDEFELPSYTPNPIPTFIYSGVVMPGSRDIFSLIDFLLKENIDFKFDIYTRQGHHFNRYGKHLNTKLFLHNYIPRKDLLPVLAKADFLVNVNTDPTGEIINAVPTKLIDYRISGRPILSYEQSKLPENTIREFLIGDYSNQFVDPDFDRYKIENVAKKFISLIP